MARYHGYILNSAVFQTDTQNRVLRFHGYQRDADHQEYKIDLVSPKNLEKDLFEQHNFLYANIRHKDYIGHPAQPELQIPLGRVDHSKRFTDEEFAAFTNSLDLESATPYNQRIDEEFQKLEHRLQQIHEEILSVQEADPARTSEQLKHLREEQSRASSAYRNAHIELRKQARAAQPNWYEVMQRFLTSE